jgi:hypothetical protein
MVAVNLMVAYEPILDAMFQMTFARRSHRVIAAASAAPEIYCGLYRRGFSRVVTAANPYAPDMSRAQAT